MRYYELEKGYFPSVTTIMSATAPSKNKQKLVAAKKRHEKEYGEGSWEIHCRSGQERGTKVHKLMEEFFENGEVNQEAVPKELSVYWKNIENYFIELKEKYPNYKIVGNEQLIYSETYGYAGRYDLCLNVNNVNVLYDLKTFAGYDNPFNHTRITKWKDYVKRPKSAKDRVWKNVDWKPKKTFKQLLMYKIGSEECLNVPIDELCILISTKDAGLQVMSFKSQWFEDAVKEVKKDIKTFYETYNEEYLNMWKSA